MGRTDVSLFHRVRALFWAPMESDRHNNINFVRFVAASAVIYGHMGALADVGVATIACSAVSTVGVRVFFLLSGYLICQSFLRDPDPLRYLARRFFRIIPGLIFVILVTTFVAGPLLSTLGLRAYLTHPVTWDYLKNCLLYPHFFLPGVFADNYYPNAVNGSLWTLPVEFSMYLLLPLILVLSKRLRIQKPTVVAVTVCLCALLLVQTAGVFTMPGVFWGTSFSSALALVPYFYLGVLFVVFPGLCKILNVQAALMLTFVLCLARPTTAVGAEVFSFVMLPYITFSFSLAKPATFGRLFAENDYSYGIYLWAFPVQQTMVFLLGPTAFATVPYALLCFAVTLPFAMVSWFLVEKPASNLGKRLTKWLRARQAQGQIVEAPAVPAATEAPAVPAAPTSDAR